MAGGKLAIDTGLNTDMYGGTTNAQNLVLQPAPDGGWEATAKVDIALAEKTYEQATMLVYGSDQDFAKLSFIKVPDGRNLEFILQQDGTPVDGGERDRTPLLPATFADTVWLRIKSDGTFLTASYSADGTTFTPFGRARALSAIPDPKVGITAFNGDGDGDDATFDFFHLVPAGTEPTCTQARTPAPGYRMLFDGTQASMAKWKQSGPGGFNFTPQCTLESFGGLGMLWYDELFDGPHTFHVEWMMPGDDNSGVFVGGWPDPGNDPFVAVNQGYEVQIDATDDADSTTGAIYNFQAANAARRDQALNPPGQWNTYEITVDAPKVYVRLNGVADQRVHLDRSGPRPHQGPDRPPEPRHRRRGVLPRRPGQDARQRRRAAAVHRRAHVGRRRLRGRAFDTCKWDRTVRYDPAGIAQKDGRLHVETSGGDMFGAGDTGPTNFVLQDAPAGDWTIETEVKVPLVKCCQQAGLLVYGSDDDYVKFDVIADEGMGQARFELRSETGDVVADPQNSEYLPYPDDDTYHLRLTRTGNTYAAAYRVTGGDWKAFGNTVSNAAVAGDRSACSRSASSRTTRSTPRSSRSPSTAPGPTPACRWSRASPTRRPAARRSRCSSPPPARTRTAGSSRTSGCSATGRPRSGARSSHTYTAPGTYQAKVTVTDPDGKTASDTVPVTVTAAGNAPPTVEVAADPASGAAPLEVQFEAEAVDPDGPRERHLVPLGLRRRRRPVRRRRAAHVHGAGHVHRDRDGEGRGRRDRHGADRDHGREPARQRRRRRSRRWPTRGRASRRCACGSARRRPIRTATSCCRCGTSATA